MNLFIRSILLILLFIVFVPSAHAFETLKKSSANPIEVSFLADYDLMFQSHIFINQNLIQGVFSTHNISKNLYTITYGKRKDDQNWILEKEVLTLDQHLFGPRLLFKDSFPIKLFVTKADPDHYRIFVSDCNADFECRGNPRLAMEPLYSWERNAIVSAFPYFKNEKYYLFYTGWGNEGLHIGMATSNDGESWQRCENNPTIRIADGPFLIEINNTFYLFFHSPNRSGIESVESTDSLSCNMNWVNRHAVLEPGPESYDINHMVAPSVLQRNGALNLYYAGVGDRWNLNLAVENILPEKFMTIVVPGFMASWNKDAILHGKQVSYSEWKLSPFVKEYDGIIQSLKNLGYKQNEDWIIFPYDWRKSIDEITNDFYDFLNQRVWNSNPTKKINIVGHSLGGLVGRVYTQKNNEKINKIITVGSPHQGIVQVYKPLESGEIDKEDTLLWLAQKLILMLNKSTIESDKDTIKKHFPVSFDLFPTFNFLKNKNGEGLDINSLSIKNNLLLEYNKKLNDILSLFTAIYGEKDARTPAGFIVEKADAINSLLGNYLDGQPTSSYYEKGDYLVLSQSANQGINSEKLPLDHGEIITQQLAIGKILSLLGIDYQNSQIVEGQKTVVSPSLVFLIKSPAQMEVRFQGDTYFENDGIIFIPNAQSGDYELNVKGIDSGKYVVHIGQIAQNNDLWDTLEGEIKQDSPSSQVDNYSVTFNNLTAQSISPTPSPTIVPTSTPMPTPTPTSVPTPTSTQTPTPNPTDTPTPTNNPSSAAQVQTLTSNPSPVLTSSIDQNFSPQILGTETENKTFIEAPNSPITSTNTQKNTAKNYQLIEGVATSTIGLILGVIIYIIKKKVKIKIWGN